MQVTIGSSGVEATFDPHRLLGAESPGTNAAIPSGRASVSLGGTLVRRGQELRLIFPSGSKGDERRRDPRLVALIVKGYAALRELREGDNAGSRPQTRKAHLCRLARTAYLAPDIVQAIMGGRQPPALTARQLLRVGELPVNWEDQRGVLGFKSTWLPSSPAPALPSMSNEALDSR